MAGQIRIMRIVWVAMVMLATSISGRESDAGPVSVSRLSSSLGPFRLSPAERHEYGAWSAYGLGVYNGLSKGGRKAFMLGIEEALMETPGDSRLRDRWEECMRLLKLKPREAASRLRRIYELVPGDAAMARLYSRLLNDSGDRKGGNRVLRRAVELTGGRDGLLLRDYVLSCSMAGLLKGRMLTAEGDLWPMLSRGLGMVDGSHPDALRSAIGYFLLCQSDVIATTLSGESGRKLSSEDRDRRQKEVASLRKRAVEVFREIVFERADSMTCYIVCQTLEAMGRFHELHGILCRLDGFKMHGSWWLEFSFKAAAVVHDYRNVCAYLDQVRFHPGLHEELLRRSIQAYMSVGGRLAKAVELARMLVKKDPKNNSYRLILAYVLAGAEQWGEALAMVDSVPEEKRDLGIVMLRTRLLQMSGKVSDAYGYLLGKVRQSEEALAAMPGGKNETADRQLVMLKSFLTDAYERLGLICIALRRMPEALDWIRRHHAMSPESAQACNLYGYMLADLGQDLPLAEDLIRRAVKKEPENVAYLDSLGWVRFRQGRYQEALKIMLQVLDLGGLGMDQDGEMRGHLGQIFDKLGMPATAKLYQLKTD